VGVERYGATIYENRPSNESSGALNYSQAGNKMFPAWEPNVPCLGIIRYEESHLVSGIIYL